MAHKHHLTALTFCSNVSRIDVEVTLRSGNPDANFAEQCHHTVQDDMRVKNGMTQTSIIRSTPRGTTAYIGSRASNRYFRCYDKSAESDGAYPNYSWRWEVEYKKERAWHVAQQVLRGRGSPENIRNIVGQAYFDYGYILPCAPIPMGWRDKGVRAETNDERRLAWLEKSIRPAIEKLSEGVPLGTILAALGLSGLMDGVTGELYTDARKAPVNLYESAVPHPDFEGVYIVSDG
jgi:DNA relaxase NicK